MTTAYDFPDLNISPILGEEQSDEEDVERGIDDDVLKGLSVSENTLSMNTLPVESSGGVQRLQPFSYDHSQQIGNSFDASSEMAFAALDCDMKRSLFSIAESCDIAGDFQESFCSILSG
ncbi:unnamed protein product [Heligmosomoides polygyrus]|uniref:Clathrin_bdg domain-containing protein n=1 Tax=Heligmosomoides polygyrus TaxID=6339 RepID=A0A183GWI3_HELPZ|nr:unnamed protein product [Heligmosomoides polygyrus]